MQTKKDYYQILEIGRDATEEEISEAYTVLRDRKRRREYDRLDHRPFRHRYRTENVFEDINFEDIFRDFGLRFNKGISRGSFCGRGGGCRRKGRRCSLY